MKTLGQVNFETYYAPGLPEALAWEMTTGSADRAKWEAAAQAVRAAVIEECAKVCEGAKLKVADEIDLCRNEAIRRCILAIRSLK